MCQDLSPSGRHCNKQLCRRRRKPILGKTRYPFFFFQNEVILSAINKIQLLKFNNFLKIQ